MAVTITRTAWTDDDGSGTTGTVINNAVKTELYGQIDTALALLMPLAGGTLTGDLLFTDALYDIGKSGATRPRDGFFSRNVVIGGTLGVTGVATFTAAPVFSAGIGTLSGDLLFTDATYDIGKSGATRPRDGFFSRNVVIGGTLQVVGNHVADLLFTDATYDIGKSGATRPRDGFFSRNLTVGGNITLTGVATGGLTLAAGTTLTTETGNDLAVNVPSTRSFFIKVNGTTQFTMANSGALTLTGIPGFAASDKYLVVDASGNVHKSAIGPAS